MEWWGRLNIIDMKKIVKPDRRLLRQYRHCGAPVVILGWIWMERYSQLALKWVSYWSSMAHDPFLWEKFASMAGKVQWVVL